MTLTVTATQDYTSPSPAVAVTVTASPVVSTPVTVYRVHEDGTQYPVIAVAGNDRLFGGTWVEVDRHAPFNQAITYRAVTSTQEGTSPAWEVTSSDTWLVHPSDPDLAVMAGFVIDFGDRQIASPATRIDILGSARPIHLTDSPRPLESGAVSVWCDTAAQTMALRALLSDGGPLLLNTPTDIGWLWIQPGAVAIKNPAPHRRLPGRQVSFPFEGTRAPDVDTEATWTYDDVTGLALNYTGLAVIYDTYVDMTFDRRTP